MKTNPTLKRKTTDKAQSEKQKPKRKRTVVVDDDAPYAEGDDAGTIGEEETDSTQAAGSDADSTQNSANDTSLSGTQETKKAERDPSIFYAGYTRRKLSQRTIITALVAADGALSVAAKALGTSYRHLKDYIAENEKLQEVLKGINEAMLDISEGTLRYHIEEQRNLTATIFHLKTKGKHRGYVEDVRYDKQRELPPVTIIYHSPRDPALLQQRKQIEDKTIDITADMQQVEDAVPVSTE
jgi:hypothetical protein